MGKKKSDIYVCFQILPYKNKANKSIFQCKFCDRQYLQNATKMESHIITQCQKVPALIRANYTSKSANGVSGGVAATAAANAAVAAAAAAAGLTGLNLSLMNKHDDLDLNELIRDYSDSSASEAPEQMVVNVKPGMYRVAKSGGGGRNSSPSGGLAISSHGGGGGRSVAPPKNSPPTFSSMGYGTTSPQSLVADFNQRSMQIRAYSQLSQGINNLSNNSGGGGSNGNNNGNGRKRARLDNQNQNNNNNNSVNNNNYYTIGGAGSAHKILIKPSHGVPAAKMPGLGRINNGSGVGTNASGAAGGATISRGSSNTKVKPPLHLGSGATIITKNAGLSNNNNIGGFKEKLTRVETAEIWRLLGRAIYSSDVPVNIVENEHWVNLLRRLQPTLTLPTSSILSNELLDQEYTRISQDIEEKVEKSHFSVLECVTVPGTRIDEFTLVFFLNCDDSPNPFLYKTHCISEPEGYTKDNLSKLIEDIVLDIGLNKVVAFMSDLSPEMEGTWEILRDKFPGLLTFGCVIHGLNSILDKILTLPEIGRMIDVIKKLYNKIEKSHELKRLVEDALGKKHKSPYDDLPLESGGADEGSAGPVSNHSKDLNSSSSSSSLKANGNHIPNNGGIGSKANSCSSANYYATKLLTKWKLVGKLTSQLISEKAVYQQIMGNPESKRVVDGLSSDSPGGKSDRSLSNHLSSESFWTSLVSIDSIIVPCLEWIEALKPDRDCSLSQVPEVFKELKLLLQSHVRNFPVDDTTKQSVQKHFLGVQRKCVNEIHFTASLLNPNQKLRGVLTDDEEAQGMEFLTYFCDSRGYHAGSILRELADYKSMNGAFDTEKLWQLGQTLAVPSWWKMVQGDSALSNIAISLARVVPSCSIPEGTTGGNKGKALGDGREQEKREKLAFIQYNLVKPNKAKLPKTRVAIAQMQQQQQQKQEVIKPKEEKKKEVVPPPAPVPAKVEKLRIKIPKKEDSESPAMDLSARLSGCSQVSDEEEEDEDDDSDEEENSSVTTNNRHLHNNDMAAIVKHERRSSSPVARKPSQQDDDGGGTGNQSSDGDDGSTKDDSSSDSDDSSSDDQSD